MEYIMKIESGSAYDLKSVDMSGILGGKWFYNYIMGHTSILPNFLKRLSSDVLLVC